MAQGLAKRLGVSRPKVVAGSAGSAAAGGQTGGGCERLYGSPTVVMRSQGSAVGRAKIVKGCEIKGVVCSLTIAGGSVAIFGTRAKVSACCVMLVGRRKFAYRYVMTSIGRSENRCGLFTIYRKVASPGRDLFLYFRYAQTEQKITGWQEVPV